MSVPGYKRFIEWIANNDEPTWTDPVEVEGMASVAMVSDLFEKDQLKVAQDVVKFRLKAGVQPEDEDAPYCVNP